MLKLGIEPKTFALLARRSNQLSYSSTEIRLWVRIYKYNDEAVTKTPPLISPP